jgi:zinc/manganese transport system substrate-binding protein
MRKFLAFFLFALVFIPYSAFAHSRPLKVVATFSILGDLVKQVGGDLVSVTTLVGPDGDAHTYKPTPNDLKTLVDADLVVENGLGMEGWVTRLISASGFKGRVVIASEGVTARTMDADEDNSTAGGKVTDPHAWQDISNARLYIHTIAHALSEVRPDEAPVFNSQAAAYDGELKKLDLWVKSELTSIPAAQRKIITSHDAFGYFGAAYGVTFMAPQGLSTEVEPTATQVAKLVEQMKAEKVKFVFFENMANPKLVKQLAKDAGATVGKPVFSDALSPADGPALTYVAMFRHNVVLFKEAMLRNGQ